MAAPVLFQCIPVYRPRPLAKMIGALLPYHCRILLDLEDGIQNPDDESLSHTRKQQARKDIHALFAALPEQKFDLRINALDSAECEWDKALLNSLNNISSVFIPKAESATLLTAFAGQYPEHKLNLIIETKKGLQNLDELLTAPAANQIEFVFFGNYDYHLDAGIYPIQEQNSHAYWELVTSLIQKTEQYNLHFGNSPYVHLGDTTTLEYAFQQLSKTCKKTYALMSLHRRQTKLYSELATGSRQPQLQEPADAGPADVISALHYKEHVVKGLSFAFSQASMRIITPHEYMLLKRVHA